MKSGRHASIRAIRTRGGFTLLEALLALFIFSTAVISLLEAINGTGRTMLLAHKERLVQGRLESLLLEASRSPERLSKTKATQVQESSTIEGDVSYVVRTDPLVLKSREGILLTETMAVSVTARWREGAHERRESAGTWVYLPLFLPTSSQQQP